MGVYIPLNSPITKIKIVNSQIIKNSELFHQPLSPGGSSPSFEGIPFKRNESSTSKCAAHAHCINLPFCLPDQQSLKTLSQRIHNTAPYGNDNSSIIEEKNQKGPQRKAIMIYSVRLI